MSHHGCRLPEGLVARSIPALPRQRYHVLRRRGAAEDGAARKLVEALLETAMPR